jgi:hypothetical protein
MCVSDAWASILLLAMSEAIPPLFEAGRRTNEEEREVRRRNGNAMNEERQQYAYVI